MGEGLGSTAGGLTSKSSKSDSSNNNVTHATNKHVMETSKKGEQRRGAGEGERGEMRSACGESGHRYF